MSIRNRPWYRDAAYRVAALVAVGVVAFSLSQATAGLLRQSAVGGIYVDANGIVSSPRIEDAIKLQAVRQRALKEVPGDLTPLTPLRKISLRQLEEAIAKHRENKITPLDDSVRYLSGLLRIQYVFVVPEENDIILAGPAEGWKADRHGNIVGITTGRPVLLLDDLMVALRTRSTSNETGISCSIDPTPEGIARLQQIVSQMQTIGNPRQTAREIEEALGPQVVTVTGVPSTSHFARVMVAADFRMKHIAMGLEDAPIAGLPSFMSLAKAGPRGMSNMLPRWWLAPDYEPLRTDADGLSWEIRGQGVRCMTEEDYVSETGEIERGAGRVNAAAQRWAEMMTDKYEELAAADSAFGHLRNVMDLAVVAALIEKEHLIERAGIRLPQLTEEEFVYRYAAPKRVATKASPVKKGRNWIISASGGVQIYPWQIADRTEVTDALAPVRAEASRSGDGWWWN